MDLRYRGCTCRKRAFGPNMQVIIPTRDGIAHITENSKQKRKQKTEKKTETKNNKQ